MSTCQKYEMHDGNASSKRMLTSIAKVRVSSSIVARSASWASSGKAALLTDIDQKRLSIISTASSSTHCTDDEDDGINVPNLHAAYSTRSSSPKTCPVSPVVDIKYHFNSEEEFDAASRLMSTAQRVCDGFLGTLTFEDMDTEAIKQDEAWFKACSKLASGEYNNTGYKHDGDNFVEDGYLPYVDHTLKQGIFSDDFAGVNLDDDGLTEWTSRASTPFPSCTDGESTSVSSRLDSTQTSSLSCSDSASSKSSSVYSRIGCEHDLEQGKDSLTALLFDMGIRHVEYSVGNRLTSQDVKLHDDLLSRYRDKNGTFFVGAAMVEVPAASEVLGKCKPALNSNTFLPLGPAHNPQAPPVYTSKRTPGTLGSSAPTTPSYPKSTGKRLKRDGRSVAVVSRRSTSDSQLIFDPVPHRANRYSTFEENVAQEIAWRQQVEQCLAERTGLRPAGHTLAHGPVAAWPMTSISKLVREVPSHPASRHQPPSPAQPRFQHIKPRHDPTTVYHRSSPFHIPPTRPYDSPPSNPSPPDSVRFTCRSPPQCNPNDRILHYKTPDMAKAFSAIWNTMCLERGRQTEFGPGCGGSMYGMDEVEEQRRVWEEIKALANKRDEEIRGEKKRERDEERERRRAERGGKGGRLDRVKEVLRIFKRRGKGGR